jgi:hypothetical protein
MSRVQLKVECCGLYGFLLIARELGEGVRECIGNAELHFKSGSMYDRVSA